MRKKRLSASSLIELLVYATIFFVIFGGVYLIFTAGVKYYTSARSMIEVQQGVQMAPFRLQRELMESDLNGITFYPNSTSSQIIPRGVVFISPRNPSNNNSFDYNTATGRCRWYKYVCYYAGTDPNDSQSLAIFRKEYVPASMNPNANPVQCGYDTGWFQGNTSLQAEIVARSISSFDVSSGDPAQTTDYNKAFNPVCIKVVLQDVKSGSLNIINTQLLLSVRN
ncbi:MAG: hypothetical protein M1536_02370 [Firmicutes bacterium]|nr:hypothetical protein [Bacillota bacterium]